MIVGLRIDACTYRGTQLGVPALVELLRGQGLRASFFFSVGPDNMGRHLWRLLKPEFLCKMLRTRSDRLYGWDILLRGTLWPGPIIGRRLAFHVRTAADADHEVGLHAWDHHAWQRRAATGAEFVRSQLELGVNLLGEVLGRPPTCSAVPGWRCSDSALVEKERFPFVYNSDCRGGRAFYPVVEGRTLTQPQIPVSLPTFDEAVGLGGVTRSNYNDWLLDQLSDDRMNVLAIHAEVEGIVHFEMFRRFLQDARQRGIRFVPLGELVGDPSSLTTGVIREHPIPGREGPVACLV